jgi:two-component system, NtrC family, sensor kinase
MSFTRKAPTVAKKQSKSIRQDLAAMLVEREGELAEVRRQQGATAEILKLIAASPTDAQPAFEAIAARANRLIGGFSTAVFRIFGNAVHLAAFTSTNPGADEALRALFPLPVAQFPGLESISYGDCAQVADTELNTAVRDLARLRGYRSMLLTPLLSKGALIGIISVTRQAPGAFGAHQLQSLQTFADQAVIAINNVAHFNETQEALRQQTATADVLKAISRSAFDLDTVLETLIATALRLCDAKHGQIFRRRGDAYRYAASQMEVAPAYLQHQQAAEIRPGRGTLIGRVALENRTVEIADAWNDPEYAEKEEVRQSNLRAMLGVPLMRDGKPIGAFALARNEPLPFTPRQIELVTTFADQAVIAIENVRLFDEVQARTRELEESLQQQTATADVLKVISRTAFDLQAVFETLLDSAIALTGAWQGTICIRDGDVCTYRAVRTAIGTEEFDDQIRTRLLSLEAKADRTTLAGRAILSGKVEQIEDIFEDPEYWLQGRAAETAGIRAVLGVPLLRNDRAEGALVLSRRQPGRYSPRVVELVRTFADQAVIAIENARLFDEVQARTRDLEESLTQQTATADVLKAISRSAFDLDTVLETLIATALRLCDATYGEIFRRHGDLYRYAASRMDVDPAYLRHERAAEITPGRGTLVGRVALENRAVEIVDAWNDPEYAEKEEARVGNVRAMLGVPLMRDGEMIGAFALGRAEAIPFSQRQVDLVATFADQAVIAIENVRLFDEVQAKTRDLEESLQQQTATADVLKVISRSAFDLQAVLTTLAESARELCGASFVTLFMRDGVEMRLRAESGCTPEIVQFLRAHPIRAGRETFTGRVMLSGEAVHLPDVLADPEYDFGDAPRIGDYRALLGVPLLRDGQVEGVFALARPEPAPFTARQIEMVRAFADQAVIAIENARLFDEVQARTRELAASLDDLRKAQDRLIQSEKLASLGQLTAGIAHEIKNPLNFINNYSALSRELIGELADAIKGGTINEAAHVEADELIGAISGNLDKIVQHGKRADSIVKNMLLHSREGSGERSTTNVNGMVEEALNLAYHGARAERPGFNVTIVKSLDPNAGAAEVYAQEITRVLLNLISNGFYATSQRKQTAGNSAYEPTISASTRDLGPKVEIAIRDNGTGVSDEAKAKMFNPFFTTKPAGEGTGLGLSLTHDIVVKQHGGAIEVSTEPDAFSEFSIILPRGAAGL